MRPSAVKAALTPLQRAVVGAAGRAGMDWEALQAFTGRAGGLTNLDDATCRRLLEQFARKARREALLFVGVLPGQVPARPGDGRSL